MPLDPRLERLRQEIAAAVEGLSAEGLGWSPPGKWCAAEVLEHLYLSYTGTIRGCQRVADGELPTPAARSKFGHRWRAMVVVEFGYFPTGRKTPQVAEPRGLPREKVLAEIGPKIAEMDGMIQLCEEKLGRRAKLLDHPVLGPLSGRQWRKFHLIHGLHHVKQIWALRSRGG
jgi:hypothetical protein